MAEIKAGTLYIVTITEYDCGAQRHVPNGTKFFTTMEEATEYAREWEAEGDRECYWRAEIGRV